MKHDPSDIANLKPVISAVVGSERRRPPRDDY